jgi:hypothetical protein
MEENEVIEALPKCGHQFHKSCIDAWRKVKTTCPLCRVDPNIEVENIHHAAPAVLLPSGSGDDSLDVMLRRLE